jgi:6-phosphogluconolactonase (cycloisomerase 2 family)
MDVKAQDIGIEAHHPRMRNRTGGHRRFAVAGLVGLLFTAAAVARPVYVTAFETDQLFGFDVAADGTLTAVAGTPVHADQRPYQSAMTPDGEHLYVSRVVSNELTIYDVAADGTLGNARAYPGIDNPRGLAISPVGHRLYVASLTENAIHIFDIDPAGDLQNPRSIDTGRTTIGLAMTPDGEHLYASGSAHFQVFDVAPNGDLSNARTFSPDGPGFGASISVTPDGAHLYGSQQDRVAIFDIEANGDLANARAVSFADDRADGVAMAPDGATLYVTFSGLGVIAAYAIDGAGDLSLAQQFVLGLDLRRLAVMPDGRHVVLTAASGELMVLDTGFTSLPETVLAGTPNHPLVRPNQRPVAAFSVSVGVAGEATQFDATGSMDDDGSIARYDWAFGDGNVLPDGGPTPSHVYAVPGHYEPSLIVTDNEGCSGTRIYTGQVASCRGGKGAEAVRQIDIPDAPPLCFGQPATIIGTEGPDVLRGTSGNDVIVGLGGDDLLLGGGGDDLICGGDGDDRIIGGTHSGDGDRCDGGSGANSINGCADRPRRR